MAYSQILEFDHVPVLKNEVVHSLACASGKHYLDLTLGGAGHALAILHLTGPTGIYWALDRDQNALDYSSEKLKFLKDRTQLFHASMSNCEALFERDDCPRFSGALIDCGVSSFQLDTAERGFSFRFDGPLDMRMDLSQKMSAYDIVNDFREDDLANVIYELGEERASRKIASRIVHHRKTEKIETTLQLAELVRSCFPKHFQFHRTDPATKTFQAIRMYVNSELGELTKALEVLLANLSEGAVISVITFHSLEDRIVKHFFKNAKEEGKGRIITKKPILPTEEEMSQNSRSRSAKLRCFEVGAVT